MSCDNTNWFLINASPDLREQINRQPKLHPKEGLRASPIAGVVLTNGDVDAIAGLLNLRERTPFVIYAHPRILGVLDRNPIFQVLAPGVVERSSLAFNEKIALKRADGAASGLFLEAFPVPGKIALFMENAGQSENFGTEIGDTIGLQITDETGDTRVLFIANCARVDEAVRARCAGASLLFFDGTLWQDEEMIVRGEGQKTGQRMGHISMSGEQGSMAALSDLDIDCRVFIHINNTNPALLADSPERAQIEAAGWRVAYDGMEIVLP